MKYHIWTLGCQYNEWDAARLDFLMQKLGFVESVAIGADVIVILACAVRQTAVDRILGKINNWQKLQPKNQKTKELKNNTNKPINPSANQLIIVTGCVLDADKKKFADKGIEIFESGDFDQLFNLLYSKFDILAPTTYKLQPKTCAYVPIMVGCDNFCSYCAVPYTRGRERSRPMKDVVCDVKALIDSGQKEIVLLGQNVNSYRIQNTELRTQLKKAKSDFTKLLEKLNSLDGDLKISFMSNHPKDMSNDIIEAVATLSKVKKEIHLPLQSGSNKILKAMNRPYTVEEYLRLVKSIKSKVYKVRISTDVIVGFPGESKEDFNKTVEVIKLVNFDAAYINKYSPRKGTKAYELGDPIPWSEKQRRWRVLNNLIIEKTPRSDDLGIG